MKAPHHPHAIERIAFNTHHSDRIAFDSIVGVFCCHEHECRHARKKRRITSIQRSLNLHFPLLTRLRASWMSFPDVQATVIKSLVEKQLQRLFVFTNRRSLLILRPKLLAPSRTMQKWPSLNSHWLERRFGASVQHTGLAATRCRFPIASTQLKSKPNSHCDHN